MMSGKYLFAVVLKTFSHLKCFSPPVNPAKEIVDPDDKKPKDWDERER